MIRALVVALALYSGTASAAPTYSDKFQEYVSQGRSAQGILDGLTSWFGKPFELVNFVGENGTYIQIVLRDASHRITYLEVLGKVE